MKNFVARYAHPAPTWAPQLHTENSRALAIESICDIEDQLTGRIRECLASINNSFDEQAFRKDSDATNPRAVFSGLSKKARFAFHLGLIDASVRHDLDKLNKLRNGYAHERDWKSLDTEKRAQDLLSQIHLYQRLKSDFAEAIPDYRWEDKLKAIRDICIDRLSPSATQPEGP